MADEPISHPVEDTAVESPVEGQGTPEHSEDYEKRYKDVQASYTQSQQELAEFKKVYEAAQAGDPEALAQFGLAVEDDEPDEYQDPYEQLKAEFDTLRDEVTQARSEAQMRQQEEVVLDYLDTEFDKLESSESAQFSDEDVFLVGTLAQAMPNKDGLPDVEGAYKRLLSGSSGFNERLVASKKSAQVQSGRAAAKTVDLSNENERVNRMAAIMEAHKR